MLALSRRSVLSIIWSIGVLFCLSTPSLAADLEIEILSPGDGIAVEKGMYAKVHYQGRLSDGKIFDDSLARDTHETRHLPLFLALAKSLRAGISVLRELKLGNAGN